MRINKYFKEYEIEPIDNIDVVKRVEFVNSAALRLISVFSKQNLDYVKILEVLQRTEICISNVPENISPVNYSYKDQTIYISDKIELSLENEFIWHELIHRIQESRNKKGVLSQLGLCNISETKVQGVAINEAAIQYVTKIILEEDSQIIDVYNMKITTKSKSYYPILTNLIEQLVCVLGDDILIDSVLNSNEEFKYNAIDTIGETNYFTIERNFDRILDLKNNIMQSNTEQEIYKMIEDIKKIYIETQRIIYKSYFDNVLKKVKSLEYLYIIKNKLDEYCKYIGTDEVQKEYLNYYKKQIEKVGLLEEKFKNKSLIVLPSNRIIRIFVKIKQAISSLFAHGF